MSHDTEFIDVQKTFLSSPRFAVIGDFTNPSRPWATKVRYDHEQLVRCLLLDKVLNWYKDHDKLVTPVDPVIFHAAVTKP